MATQTTSDDLPPPMALYQIATGYYFSRALFVAAALGIADLLSQGPRHADQLAKATGTHAPSLRRVLRLLVTVGVFAENEDGSFQLTALGECLRSDVPHSFRPAALLFTGPLEWQSWGALLNTVQTGETALEHVHGMNAFEYMAQHPDEAAVFDQAMAAFTALTANAVAAAYDFSGIRTLVDVGGGNGALLLGILNAHPHLHGIVFDQPRAIEGARERIAAAGLVDRCQGRGGDFFAGVPEGGDAYVLKHVIHDWDDRRATQILDNCRRAMPAQVPLLIVEGVYPQRVDQSPVSKGAAANDVNMLVCTGGRQRSETEFRQLYEAAGFRLTRIIPTLAGVAIIEGMRR